MYYGDYDDTYDFVICEGCGTGKEVYSCFGDCYTCEQREQMKYELEYQRERLGREEEDDEEFERKIAGKSILEAFEIFLEGYTNGECD